MALEAGEGGGEDADGGVRRRHGGVAAGRAHGELEAQVALLGGADQRRRRRQAGDQALADQAALVEHQLRLDAATAEEGGDGRGAAAAADLFVVAEGQEHGAARPVAARQQQLRRLERADHSHLVVEGAAAPDPAAGDAPGERRHGPAAAAGALGRHHVEVRQQQDGRQRGVGAAPGVEQAVAVHGLARQRRVDARVGLVEVAVEAGHLGRLGRQAVRPRHGAEAQGGGQPFGGGRRVDLEIGHRTRRDLARAQHRRAHDQDDGEEQQDGGEAGEDLLHRRALKGGAGPEASVEAAGH